MSLAAEKFPDGMTGETVTPSLPTMHVRKSQSHWVTGYRRLLVWSDAAIVVTVVLTAEFVRFGFDFEVKVATVQAPAILVSGLLAALWIAVLHVTRVSDVRIIGSGTAELSRVAKASLTVFGLMAIIDLLFRLNVARGFIAIALPLGTILLILSHLAWRIHLRRERAQLRCMSRVLVVGSERSARPMVSHLERNPSLGYEVVGVCLPTVAADTTASITIGKRCIPVLGDFSSAATAVQQFGATTVAVTSAEVLGHSAMRELSWELEGLDVDMLVDPGVIDVAGPRMLVRPVAGLPMLHIDKPTYSGANRILKNLVDKSGALALLLVAWPILVACAIAVKLDSQGPVFYKAARVGVNNVPFRMWKFRSMVTDADTKLADLSVLNEGAGLLFKIRDDPRVTRVGKFIRRFSLDELPQLFNVLGGSMSLVGPRPPLPAEVARYEGPVTRRMLVKPGITGLWQVSGRSDLSWEESVRLDLTYVENWSIATDIQILWRTVRAVFARSGAY